MKITVLALFKTWLDYHNMVVTKGPQLLYDTNTNTFYNSNLLRSNFHVHLGDTWDTWEHLELYKFLFDNHSYI